MASSDPREYEEAPTIIGLLAYAKSTRTHGWRIVLMAKVSYSRKLAEAKTYSRLAKTTHGWQKLLTAGKDYSRPAKIRTGRGEIAYFRTQDP